MEPRLCWYHYDGRWHDGRCFGFASESLNANWVQVVAIVESKNGNVFTIPAENVRFIYCAEVEDAK